MAVSTHIHRSGVAYRGGRSFESTAAQQSTLNPHSPTLAGLGELRFPHPSALSGLSHHSGGSIVCSLRIVISASFGEGNPTEVSVFSNSSLDQRVRMLSSQSHTPTM
jgi:hypothetical protein